MYDLIITFLTLAIKYLRLQIQRAEPKPVNATPSPTPEEDQRMLTDYEQRALADTQTLINEMHKETP
jgi:hypothetical protein